MIKHLTIVLVFLITFGSQASAEDFRGRMDCTVKTNKVVSISEGIGKVLFIQLTKDSYKYLRSIAAIQKINLTT